MVIVADLKFREKDSSQERHIRITIMVDLSKLRSQRRGQRRAQDG